MHEYGCFKLLEFSNGWTEEFFDEPVINYGMIAPLNFVASVEIMVLHIYELSHLYILSYSIIKNPVKLLEYYRNNEIKAGYLPPSYIRVLGDKIKDNSIGELCFAVPFTRGYVNLPEQTRKAFVEGFYHTGAMSLS